jgi:hypothetical protein
MFGFIKNLVKGNDNNFFLELKEEVDSKVAEAKTKVSEATTKVAELTKEDKKEDTKEKQPASSKETKIEIAPAPAPTPAPAAASSNGKMTRKEAATAAKASKIDAAKKARAEKEAAEARPKDPSELAAAAVMKKPDALSKETNFATKYLMTPSSNGRRRPGPNMNSFLEMASQVKAPTQKN